MTEKEFINIAKQGGYATRPVIKRYIADHDGEEYDETDLMEVRRMDLQRYNSEHLIRSHGLGAGCGTTKRYTVYNSQKSGGSR